MIDPPDLLDERSLDWALTHITKYGDSDLLPKCFEFEAIKHSWTRLKKKLSETFCSDFEGRALNRYLVPKSGGGYRVTIQLDPLDSLVYTAMVYEAAELIEKSRLPVDSQIACSYRIAPTATGDLFISNQDGWSNFSNRSNELANDCKYVLTADISDFYNQIGHHRVRNALETSGVPAVRAKNLEHFLMNLTRGQSRGIPVGQSASIVLAEACLADVDLFLLGKNYRHVRWVDDFRIFCNTAREVNQALHDLTEYLFTAHRLSLGAGKTEFFKAARFRKQIIDPQTLHQSERDKKISVLKQVAEALAYGATTPDPTKEEEAKVAVEALRQLLTQELEKKQIHLGVVRYLFRKAVSMNTRILFDLTVSNLEILAPALREVCNYLIKICKTTELAEKAGERLRLFLANSPNGFLEYSRLWVAEFALARWDVIPKALLTVLISGGGDRYRALLAAKTRDIPWVRSNKEIWQNYKPWERRAVIASASALGADEKNYWLQRVQNASDDLDKALADFYKGPGA